MKIREELLKIAGNQNGVIAKFQLIDLGFSRTTIEHHLQSNVFLNKGRGTYSLLGSKNTWHQQATVAVLTNGKNALLSHTSALKNLDLLDKNFNDAHFIKYRFERDLRKFHIVTNRNVRNCNDYYVHRSVSIEKFPTANLVNGIPQVNIERAIIDSARIVGEKILDQIIFKGLRMNLFQLNTLSKELNLISSAPGRSKSILERVIERYAVNGSQIANIESSLEKRIYDVISKHFEIEIYTQYEIKVYGRRYRADFAIPDEMILIEVDGFEFHQSRSQLDSDRRRQNDILSAGWKILRITAKFTDQEIVSALNALRSRVWSNKT